MPGPSDIMFYAEGPSTQHLRSLVPNTMKTIFLAPETSNIGYLDPLGNTPYIDILICCHAIQRSWVALLG